MLNDNSTYRGNLRVVEVHIHTNSSYYTGSTKYYKGWNLLMFEKGFTEDVRDTSGGFTTRRLRHHILC